VILIPAFNEEETISKVLQSIPLHFEGIKKIVTVVVNDGSTDRTKEIAELCGAIVVDHSRNYGVGRAFQNGLIKGIGRKRKYYGKYGCGWSILSKDIPQLIKPILEGKAGLVVGDRFQMGRKVKKNHSTCRQ
jgi:glycosyltransferase involved in cell wall biosynthesis